MKTYVQLVKECKTIGELSEIVDTGFIARRDNVPFDVAYSRVKKAEAKQ